MKQKYSAAYRLRFETSEWLRGSEIIQAQRRLLPSIGLPTLWSSDNSSLHLWKGKALSVVFRVVNTSDMGWQGKGGQAICLKFIFRILWWIWGYLLFLVLRSSPERGAEWSLSLKMLGRIIFSLDTVKTWLLYPTHWMSAHTVLAERALGAWEDVGIDCPGELGELRTYQEHYRASLAPLIVSPSFSMTYKKYCSISWI